ncbi:hypothetical protein LXA43DRAFT_157185 [Ganoderma leucocontextum]|nr:hypothetical protein LXA43DRAFT_157185 [Ganoderma leucocontextum]
MSQESNVSAHAYNRDTAPVNSQGQVVCYHEEPAILRTSHTVANPGRDFFSCRKDREDPERCRFFAWADDHSICAARESRRAAMRDMSANTPTATPQRPSQAQRAQMARLPDTPISPQKRRRTPSPPPPFPPSTGNPFTPKQRRLNGTIGTPESLAARNAAIAAALKPTQGSEARLKSIEEELAAVARQVRMTPSGNRRLPQTHSSPSASSHMDVQGFQTQRHSDGSSTSAPPPPSLAMQNRTPAHGMGSLHSSRSRLPSSQVTQSQAVYSITDEVREADMEDEIEDAVWIEHEPNLENKQIQTDPVEDEGFDDACTIDEMWSSQASVASIPFTLPATGVDVDDYAAFGSGASGPTQLREPGRVSQCSPARLPPQTPSSRQAGSSRAYASGGNATEGDGGGSSMSTLLTPPGSLQRDHQPAEDGASSSAGRRGRDSVPCPLLRERQGRGLDPSPSPSPSPSKGSCRDRSQWQMIQDDPENPFHERVAALRTSSQTSFAVDAVSGVGIQAGSADGLPGPLSADLVEQRLNSLAGLPEYIRKLERRERAAQKSAEVKAKKIARLEEEVQRLRNTNRTLEETVAALEARR